MFNKRVLDSGYMVLSFKRNSKEIHEKNDHNSPKRQGRKRTKKPKTEANPIQLAKA